MLNTAYVLAQSRRCGWTVLGPREVEVRGLGTDSRADLSGQVFLALVGESFDGHDFIDVAVSRGASALVVQRLQAPTIARRFPDHLVVGVEDTLFALGSLAQACRDHDSRPLVAITGSAGKTSTRLALVQAAEAAGFKVHATPGNENNRIGVPRFLVNLPAPREDASTPGELIVVEVGTSEPGEIARLGAITQPDVAVVVSVSAAHTECLLDEDGVAHEKGDLLRSSGRSAQWAVADSDPRLLQAAKEGHRQLVSSNPARLITTSWQGAPDHLKANGAKVLAVLEALGVEIDQKVIEASAYAAPLGRGGVIDVGLLRIMDDTYNANPASMKAALKAAAQQAKERPLVVCLGEMRELGPASETLHREIAAEAADCGAVQIYLAGPYGAASESIAREKGCQEVFLAADGADLQKELYRIPRNAFVLVKGSRGAKMERIVEALQAQAGAY